MALVSLDREWESLALKGPPCFGEQWLFNQYRMQKVAGLDQHCFHLTQKGCHQGPQALGDLNHPGPSVHPSGSCRVRTSSEALRYPASSLGTFPSLQTKGRRHSLYGLKA